MKALTSIILITIISKIETKCSDSLSCFQNKLFNFGSPGQNIYQINQITSNNVSSSINILAYGDFNNDLHTDFVASNLNNLNQIQVFVWDSDQALFSLNQSLNTTTCPVSNIFLYDIDLDGLLDIIVWGQINQGNCLLPFQHQSSGSFSALSIIYMQTTANPFIISFGVNNAQKTIGLLVYQNGSRVILKFEPTNNNFLQISWSSVFVSSTDYSTTAFASPHWNSYLDLTGDCFGDVLIVNSNNVAELWTSQDGKNFQLYTNFSVASIASLSFSDMNYDGLIDLVIAYQQQINVYINTNQLKSQTDFCVPQYKSVSFDFNNPIKMNYPSGFIMNQGSIQIKDINIDGYPDLLLVLTQGSSSNISIFLNSEGKQFVQKNQYKLPTQTFNNVISASFIDFWQNGIIDIIVCTEQGLTSFYNNYLQQNSFFIKGYGANGVSVNKGAQIVGASFYWVNSVGDGYRTTYQPQIYQTAYNSLQTPFAYCGLGKANNYVQSFTLGIYGTFNSWSPIIPNSQLAVYAQGTNAKQWAIRIYVLPTDSLVYVVIVSAVVLTILGAVLAGLKCKNYRKKEEPLMQFIH